MAISKAILETVDDFFVHEKQPFINLFEPCYVLLHFLRNWIVECSVFYVAIGGYWRPENFILERMLGLIDGES